MRSTSAAAPAPYPIHFRFWTTVITAAVANRRVVIQIQKIAFPSLP